MSKNISAPTIITTAALLFLVACARSGKAPTTEDTLDRIRRTGQIEACIVVEPPWGIKDVKTGALSGYLPEAMNTIAEKMNARVMWRETTWGNMAADLEAKRCDVAPGLFEEIPRAESVASTLPPLEYLGHSVLVKTNDLRFKNVKDIFEFDRPEITIAVATGDSGDLFVREHFHAAKIKRVDLEASDLSRFFVEVSAGRADAAIGDANEVSLYARRHAEVRDILHGNQFNVEPIGWAVRLDDEKWRHFLETALQFLDTQGTLDKLRRKYGVHCLVPFKQYKLQ